MRRGVLRLAGATTVSAVLLATHLRAEDAAPAAPVPATAAPTPTVTPTPAPTSSTVKAARLALVGRTRDHSIYIDKPTLRKLSADRFELWAEVHADDGERVKFLMQLNCSERSYLIKSEVVYDGNGEVLANKTNRAPALQYVVPESASEFIHEAVCP